MAQYIGLGTGDSPLPSLLDVQKQQQEAQGDAGFLELSKAAIESEWLGVAAFRASDRDAKANKVDTNWMPSKAQVDALLAQGYSDRELEELGKSGSQEAFDLRLGFIQEDRERAQILQGAGLAGLGAQIVAGIADPTTIPMIIASGGVAGVAKVGKLSGAVRGALAASATSAATEAILMQADTQRDWEDVALAGVAAGALGAGIGALTARRAGAVGGKLDELDDLDAAVVTDKPLLALPAPKAIEVPPTPAQAAEIALAGDLPKVAGYLPAPSKIEVESASVVAENNLLFSKIQLEARQAELDKLNDQLIQITGNPRIQESLALAQRVKAEVVEQIQAVRKLDPKRQLQGQLDRAVKAMGKLRGELGDMEAKAPIGRGKTRAARQAKIDAKKAELEKMQAKVAKLTDNLNLTRAIPKLEAELQMLESGAVPTKYRARFKELQDELNGLDAADELELATRKGYIEDDIKYLSQEIAEKEAKLVDLMNPPAARGRSVAREKLIVKKDAPEAKAEVKPDEPKPVEPDAPTADNAALFNVALKGRVPELRKTISEWAKTPMSRFGRSVGSRLSRSKFQSIRGINAMLNSLAQGGLVGKHAAAVLQSLQYNRALNKARPAQDAVNEMFSRAGMGQFARLSQKGAEMLEDFNSQMVLYIKGVEPTGTNADLVKQAGDSLANVFEDSLQARKLAGVRGFEHIDVKRDYWSFIPKFDKMQAVIGKLGAEGKEKVTDAIAGSYLNGYRLSRIADKDAAAKIARKIAEAQVERTMLSNVSGINRVKSILDAKTRSFMAKHMQEAGVSDEELDLWFKAMEAAEDKLTMSNRAKTSFGADITFEVDGIRMVDLIDTDMDVALRYAREASADVALAKVGFKSRYDVENMLEDSQQRIQNSLMRDMQSGKRTQKEVSELTDELEDEVKLLRSTMKQLYGESLEADADGTIPKLVHASRLARGVSSAISLSWNGLASIPELGNVIARQGLFTVLRQLPKFKVRPSQFAKDDPILEAWQDVIGMYGHTEGWFHGSRKSTDVLQEMSSSIGNIEKGVRTVGEAQQLLSGFKHIQHGWEEINLRSMIANMDRAAFKGTPSAKMYRQFAEAGMEPDELDEVMKFMKGNRKQVNGFDVADIENMPIHLRDRLGAAMLTQLNRAIQKQFIGEMPELLNKEWGRLMFQFLSFPVAAIEKQLLHGVKTDVATFASASAWQAGLAYGAYMAYTYGKAPLAADKDEYLENALSTKSIMYGTMARMGGLGSSTLALDALATFNALPDELMGRPGEAGAQSMAKAPAAPAAILRAGGAAVGLAGQGYQAAFGEDYDEEAMKRHARALYRSTPILNSAALGIGFAVINSATN